MDEFATRLPRHVSALPLARDAIDSLELPSELREDARLIVSELVSNAVRHGRGTITLLLARGSDGALKGSVVDDGHGFDRPNRPPTGPGPGGWGLTIVNTLSQEWGIASGPTGVWFRVAPPLARA